MKIYYELFFLNSKTNTHAVWFKALNSCAWNIEKLINMFELE